MFLRMGVATTAFVMVVVSGFAGVASASVSDSGGTHVKPGGQWTVEVTDAACEVQTIGANGTWTADLYGDAGTYTGGGTKIKEVWTAGDDINSKFTGKWSTSAKDYTGTFKKLDKGETGQLVKGKVATWDGFTC